MSTVPEIDGNSGAEHFDRRSLQIGHRGRARDLHRRRAVEGRGVRPRWWQRLRSLTLLPALVVSLGVALAATIGLGALALFLAVRNLAG